MPIIHAAKSPNGISLGYHLAVKLDADLVSGKSTVTVSSYIDEAGYIAGLPLAWMWYVQLETTEFTGTGPLLDDVQSALIGHPDSPFHGGQIVELPQ